jgi:hypothetical protein
LRRLGEETNRRFEEYGFEREDVPAGLLGFNALLWVEYGVRI